MLLLDLHMLKEGAQRCSTGYRRSEGRGMPLHLAREHLSPGLQNCSSKNDLSSTVHAFPPPLLI